MSALLIVTDIHGTNYLLSGNARTTGMAGAHVMLSDEWSGYSNPAGLSTCHAIRFGLTCENYYMVPELIKGSFSVAVPVKNGGFGFNYSTFGNSYYGESEASLSYGRSLGGKLRAGIGFNYLMINQPEGYGNLFAFIPSAGLQVIPVKSLVVGLFVFNPARQQFNPKGNITIPLIIRAGIGCKLGDEILFCLEAEKKPEEILRLYGGMEIVFEKIITLRFGASSGKCPVYSFGMGFRFRKMVTDLAVSRHPVLGFSPGLTIGYSIK
jgi:hypothetical protein